MLEQLKLCMNHARRVRSNRSIHFAPNVNVIAGPNGTGKSTILRAIYSCEDCKKKKRGKTVFHYFNAETMNPRNTTGPVGDMSNMVLRIRSLFSSHGEIMKAALTSIPIQKGDCLLVDEPEAGQDMDGIRRIREGFEAICAEGGQVIIASHHPAFWQNAHLIELGSGYARKVREQFRIIAEGE